MKKIFLTTLIGTLIIFSAYTQNRSIEFNHAAWQEVIAKAGKENKAIFVDAYTTWCGPCKFMAANVFTNDTVADFFNGNFVSAKIDMEKGEGVELAKKWEVKAYPSFLFFDPKGELMHRACGSMSNNAFIEVGKDALNPEKQLMAKKKLIESGKADNAIKREYINALAAACMSYTRELSEYFAEQKDAELSSRDNWNLIFSFANDFNSKEFNYLIDNKTTFSNLYTKDSVENKIENVYSSSLNKLAYKGEDEKFQKAVGALRKSGIANSEKIILVAQITGFKQKKDWNNFALTTLAFADKYAVTNPAKLNAMAWDFYENVDDKKMLEHAVKWAKQSTDIKAEYANTDTYAAVLYKAGNMKEAKVQAEKAIELAKKENADFKETQALLDKLNKEK